MINNQPLPMIRKRVAIYCRVSTDEQGKGYSLTTQLEACRKYAKGRGYAVAGEFAEEFTGARLDRPELNKLRELVINDSINAVVVYDLDRLARKSVYQMLIEEEFNRKGAVVEYVNGQYEDTDEGRLQKQIKSSIAEYEKAKILERSKRGKFGKAKSGFVLVGSRPPYGYTVKSEPHKAWLEIDVEEARVVRLVYEWYLRGKERGSPMSIRGVAKELCAMQVPTRGDQYEHVAKKQGSGVWAPAMITHILKNEAYAGTWYYGKTKMVSDGQESSRTPKPNCGLGKQVAAPRADWIAVPVPPIIERTDWEAAQARMKANKRILNGRPSNNQYLLSRRLRCSRCGYGVRGQIVHQKNFYYHCNGKRQLVARCDLPSVRGEWVDTAVWQWVKDLLLNPRNVAEGLRNSQSEMEQANRVVQEQLNIVEAQLADAQAQLSKLLDLYLTGEFPKGILVERKARLEQIINDLEIERGEMSTQLQTALITNEQIGAMEAFCAEVRAGIDQATFEDKRRYFDLLDVRGKLAVENDERVIYITCLIGKQRLVQMPISPSSNTGGIATIRSGCR